MQTIKRPFEIKFLDIGEVRMGSPYNHCNIQVIGTNRIKLPKAGWQDKYAWTLDSTKLVLVKWNFDNNEPSFHLFLIDTINSKTMESPKILGLPDNISIIGDTVRYKKFLYNKTKSTPDNLCCYFDEEYKFQWPLKHQTMKQNFLYYLLFILAYTGIYFIASFYYMDYEDHLDASQQGQIRVDIIVAQIFFHFASFPFGLIKLGFFNLITNCFLNPLFIGWTLQRLFKRQKEKIKKYAIIINATLTALCTLTVLYFILK